MKQCNRFCLVAATLFFSMPLFAMDWPVQNATMVRNFGFNERGKPVLGTVFEGEGNALAVGAGELIFSRPEKNAASRLPSPLGAWTVLDHGDGLVSIYARYRGGEAEQQPEKHSPRVAQGETVAAAGVSGWSRRQGFYFVLFDRRERRWVNPSMVISPLPDTRPPQIVSVALRGIPGGDRGSPATGGQVLPLNNARNAAVRLAQGRYAIVVNAVDTMVSQRDSPLAPHRINCSVNGVETGSLQFETISARDGVLLSYRNGLVPAQRVYAPFPAFEAGEVYLNRGQAQLEIIVQDIAGNSHSAFSRLVVE